MSYIKELRTLIGHKRIIGVACSAIIEYENKILLQLRSDTLNYGTPGGIMELNETIIETLIREVKEETNLEINPKEVTPFGIYSGEKCLMVYPNEDEVEYVIFVFYVKLDSIDLIKKDDESLSLEFFTRDNLPKNIKSSDKLWINKWVNKDFKLIIDWFAIEGN